MTHFNPGTSGRREETNNEGESQAEKAEQEQAC